MTHSIRTESRARVQEVLSGTGTWFVMVDMEKDNATKYYRKRVAAEKAADKLNSIKESK